MTNMRNEDFYRAAQNIKPAPLLKHRLAAVVSRAPARRLPRALASAAASLVLFTLVGAALLYINGYLFTGAPDDTILLPGAGEDSQYCEKDLERIYSHGSTDGADPSFELTEALITRRQYLADIGAASAALIAGDAGTLRQYLTDPEDAQRYIDFYSNLDSGEWMYISLSVDDGSTVTIYAPGSDDVFITDDYGTVYITDDDGTVFITYDAGFSGYITILEIENITIHEVESGTFYIRAVHGP
jgi:hypothetical protein